MGVYSLVLSTAIVQLMQFILYELILRERLNFSRFDKALQKRMLKYSLPLIPNALAVWVLALSDRYIILHFWNPDQVGLYGVAARFATAVSLVANGIYMSYTTFAFDKKGDSNDREYYSKILNAFVLAIVMICLTISMGSKEIIQIMAEAKYADTVYMIAPLLFSQLFYLLLKLNVHRVSLKILYELVYLFIESILGILGEERLIDQFPKGSDVFKCLLLFVLDGIEVFYIGTATTFHLEAFGSDSLHF